MGCWVARKMAAGVEKHLGRFFLMSGVGKGQR
jgi:hypothetical protein